MLDPRMEFLLKNLGIDQNQRRQRMFTEQTTTMIWLYKSAWHSTFNVCCSLYRRRPRKTWSEVVRSELTSNAINLISMIKHLYLYFLHQITSQLLSLHLNYSSRNLSNPLNAYFLSHVFSCLFDSTITNILKIDY